MQEVSIKITAVIITLNEEHNILRCIQSLKLVADEILVYDSFSKDKTVELSQDLGARVIQSQWLGYAKTKNLANGVAMHDWILSLDADEELSPELQESILKAKQKPQTYAYAVKRVTYYCGNLIRYTSWNPDVKVRLFHRKFAEWDGDFLHEYIKLKDNIKPIKLRGACYHYTINTISEHLERIDRYSELSAQEYSEKRKKITYYHLFLKPIAEFFISFILKQGFRDGFPGFVVSVMNSYAKFLRYSKAKMQGYPKK